MAFCGRALATSAMGGPVALAVTGGALVVGYAVIKVANFGVTKLAGAGVVPYLCRPSIGERQDRGDLDSSDVEEYLNLGTYGTYE